MRRLVWSMLFASACASAPPAKPVEHAQVPAVAAAAAFVPPVPIERRLKNGARVWIVERSALPLVNLEVVWPTGAYDDPLPKAGLASLAADLLDEGAGKWGALELAEEFARRGARVASGAGWDGTDLEVFAHSRVFNELLPIVGEILSQPRFDVAELERLRGEHLTALMQSRDAPGELAAQVVSRTAYPPEHRYSVPIIGTEASIKALTRADVLDFATRTLGPERATVVIVGDVKADDIVRRLDEAWAGWKQRAPIPRARRAEVAVTASRRIVLVDRPNAAQTELRIAVPSLPRKHPDHFPLMVANMVFGGQFSSRLNMNLREKHGFTYGARSDFAWRRDGGPFMLGAPVKTAVTLPALKEALAELDRFATGKVDADELRLAKDFLTRQLGRWFETLPSTTGVFSHLAVHDLPPDFYRQFSALVEAVTPAEIEAAVMRHVVPKQMSIIGIGDVGKIGPGILDTVGAYKLEGKDR